MYARPASQGGKEEEKKRANFLARIVATRSRLICSWNSRREEEEQMQQDEKELYEDEIEKLFPLCSGNLSLA